MHYLYQFSLRFFMDIVESTLGHSSARTSGDYETSLSTITKKFFDVTFDRVARGLMQEDRLLFAISLLTIRLEEESEDLDGVMVDFLLGGGGETMSARNVCLPLIRLRKR